VVKIIDLGEIFERRRGIGLKKLKEFNEFKKFKKLLNLKTY